MILNYHCLKKHQLENFEFDNLIIGNGLAGTTLMLKLFKSQPNQRSLMISNPTLSNCSRVAAGMANPLAFKRLAIIPNGEILINSSIEFYTELEADYNFKLIHLTPTLKFISSTKELNDLSIFLENESNTNLSASIVKNDNSRINSEHFLKVNSTYWLDTVKYLSLTDVIAHEKFKKVNETFYFEKLHLVENGFLYEGNKSQYFAKRIFFCEGHLVTSNPYFNWIPMKPAKGETLTLQSSALKTKEILNKDAYLVPLGNDVYKLGATYKWDNLNDTPEISSKEELVEKLTRMTSANFNIMHQNAGVRPSSKDRQPILGEHPSNRNMYIFNALGTRGVMLAPYYADMLLNFIFNQNSIDSTVSLHRFKKELALLESQSKQ